LKKSKQVDAGISVQTMLNTLPRGCLGEFDFVSGVLYIDCSRAAYRTLERKREKLGRRWDRDLTSEDKLLVETSMHEYFHYLQVLSSGYLFEMVGALLDALTATANRLEQNQRDSERLASLGRFSQRILRPLTDTNEETGLCPRDLIESAAYHFQCRSLGSARNHEGMLKALELPNLEPEYKRAYEHASEKLQEDTFGYFLSCVGAALFFADPAAAFDDLLDQIAIIRKSRKRDILRTSFGAIVDRHPYIGTTVDVWQLRKDSIYPWYEAPITHIAKSKSMPPAFFGACDEAVLSKVHPPMAFRDGFKGDLGIPTMFAVLAMMAGGGSLRFTLPYTGPRRSSGDVDQIHAGPLATVDVSLINTN